MNTHLRLIVVFTIGVFCAAPTATAAEGALTTVQVSATNIDAGTSPMISGGFGYRFTNVVGFGVEVSWVPTLTPQTPVAAQLESAASFVSLTGTLLPTTVPTRLTYTPDGGRAVLFTTNVRLDMPTASARITPYVIGGGGAGIVREKIRSEFSVPQPSFVTPGGVPVFTPRTVSAPVSRSFTGLALTLGGGAAIRLTSRLSVDADLRYLALLGSRDLHIGRFGGGIEYRF